jgi:hypothetical protein
MDRLVTVIGIDPEELRSIRTLVSLLRHPDPNIPKITRQALGYLVDMAARQADPEPDRIPPLQSPGRIPR